MVKVNNNTHAKINYKNSPLYQDKFVFKHKEIEKRVNDFWNRIQLNNTNLDHIQKKFYNLMMFPYPSAEGLHVGNMYAFTGSDIFGRFKRMQGCNVFEPIGLDGFGIHSENYALKISRHPMDQAQITKLNYYNQLQKIGAMFDRDRTLETYDPDYYKWTQWLFIQMFKHGLAYRGKANVNFCPSCKTVLADEQVIDGKCERCGNIVEKRLLEQWFFRITAYAEKLLSNISNLKWSQTVKTAQVNWIGKKEGINITYEIFDSSKKKKIGEIVCFTTTPVNFAATFLVIAPEHDFITQIYKVIEKKQIDVIGQYVKKARKKSDQDRIAQGRNKTGVFSGVYAKNHVTGIMIPVWISDFVLNSVGTGAIQACPGHDLRDFEFAKTFGLPIVRVVVGKDGDTSPINEPVQVIEHGPGKIINSGFLNDMEFSEAMEKTKKYFEEKGWGKRVSNYHLRDWLVSRQRYWGPPIPMVYCDNCAKNSRSWFTSKENQIRNSKFEIRNSEAWNASGWYPVLEEDLPVILPRIDDYKPGDDGIAPLAKHKEFYETTCPGCGGKAVRETDVSDTFLDSSWYFLRYPSVDIEKSKIQNHPLRQGFGGQAKSKHNSIINTQKIENDNSNLKFENYLEIGNWKLELPWNREVTRCWLPVDMYTGGAEHSVLHLLYSRFITMALKDFGYLDFDEPFKEFYAHGLVIKDGAKMSKSKGNVVNPDEYIEAYGADALRLYLMFMGPFNQGGDFRDSAMEGMSRWIKRIWKMSIESINGSSNVRENSVNITDVKGLENSLNKLVKVVGDDLDARRYNTAIAKMMEFTNSVKATGSTLPIELLKKFLLILSPLAPYITEELWLKINGTEAKSLKKEDSIHSQSWPEYDASALSEATIHLIIQVNGKLRDQLEIPVEKAGIQDYIEDLARKSEKVVKWLEGREVLKVIFVPKKLINFVVK